jgi:hypothetical protein
MARSVLFKNNEGWNVVGEALKLYKNNRNAYLELIVTPDRMIHKKLSK